MILSQTVFVALTVIAGALATPFDLSKERDVVGNPTEVLEKRSTPNSEGYHNGYFYSWWSDGIGSATYTMGEDSSYSTAWKDVGNFYGGIGWNPGRGRTINYSGTFNSSGNAYLSVYGWTRKPLVEYYVIESFGTYDPGSAAPYKGSFDSDGASYKVYLTTRVNQAPIDGESILRRYWSVRQEKRVGGSVNMQNHFDAWASFGMDIGIHDFQILATEGYQSSGNSDIYVEIE